MSMKQKKKIRFLFRNMKLKLIRFFKRLNKRGRLIAAGAFIFTAAMVVFGIVLAAAQKPANKADDREASIQSAMRGEGEIFFDITLPTASITPTLKPAPAPTAEPTPDPTLRRGMESEEVKLLQIRLMSLNFLDLDEPTFLYGPQTEEAVRSFQRQVNFMEETESAIEEDGVAGAETLALIYAQDAPKYVIKEGMRGTDITAMQEQLVDLGYMDKATGYYGTETVKAIRDFQGRNDLSADGLAGEKTVQLLYSPKAKESASKVKAARTKANIEKMIATAIKKLGSKYVLGTRGPSTFDCSGLVYYCLNQAGSNRRRLNAAGYSQVSEWQKITSVNSLQRGDLVFFYDDDYTKVGHVGIVISGTEMIDASSNRSQVVRRSYKTSYWKKHFVCGRRPW